MKWLGYPKELDNVEPGRMQKGLHKHRAWREADRMQDRVETRVSLLFLRVVTQLLDQ